MKSKIKALIQIGLFLVAILLSFSLLGSISKIIGSNQKIVDAQNKVNLLEKENKDMNQKLQAVKSTEFVEQEARDKLGLAKNGEIVVVLPDEATLRSLAPKLETEKESLPIPVWQKWLKLFL